MWIVNNVISMYGEGLFLNIWLVLDIVCILNIKIGNFVYYNIWCLKCFIEIEIDKNYFLFMI